jgi:PKD repeat protein/glucose/arabinose dehydrogenase
MPHLMRLERIRTHPGQEGPSMLLAFAAAANQISKLFGVALIALAGLLVVAPRASAVILPSGFQQSTAISGLVDPMDLEIAADGRVFVAEKSGIVKTFQSVSDTTPTTVADLRTQVHNFSSRGLLGLAVDPNFPAKPYIYLYYTLDAPVGGIAPTWGVAGQTSDPCPGDTDEVNCVVSARVSRLRVEGELMSGPEQVLINDWCQQFEFHSGGGLEFGADGYLYVSGGDGARWEIFDYGQLGNPMNPCADPPSAVGGPMAPPTAEGGRLRAQDLRTGGDPLGLAGSLIRVHPDTGEGVPGNPMFTSPDANERRMIAHGFRNPARLAVRPGTNDVWVADRGGGYWEELDRVQGGADPVRNFGWPCYEGGMDANGVPYARVRPRSDDQGLDICENLYAEGSATSAPYWAYDHEQPVVEGETCKVDPVSGEPAGNQISGINFYPQSGSFPAPYRNALFFADRLRDCMYAMLAGPDGLPARGRVIAFAQGAQSAMDIEVAPSGDLLYVDRSAEVVRRIAWTGSTSNQAPTAVATADTLTGNSPLTVNFTSTGTTDADPGELLTYEWDLDGDGQFDDSADPSATHTFLEAGTYAVTLRVTDTSGASDTDTVTIFAEGPAQPTTLTFFPLADARVEEANPDTNFGTSARLQATASIPRRESYLRFRVTGISGPVLSARLRLTSTTDGTKDGPALFRTSDSWSENILTWANRPAHDSQAVGDVGAIPLGTVADYDAEALVTGDGDVNVALISTLNDNVDFGSREFADPVKRPQLVVTYDAATHDTEPPTAPANVTAQAPSHDRVDLSWSAATDNVGISGYEVLRDGQPVATVRDVTSYADTTVRAETRYEYTVRALDPSGNRSAASAPAAVTTPAAPDTQAPTAPAGLNAVALTPRRVDLTWTAASDDRAVTNYEVYRDGALLATTGAVTSYSDMTAAAQTTYEYTVRALDAAANRSPASNPARVTTPAAPTTTLSFAPVADAHVDEATVTTNYGKSSALQVLGGKLRRETYLRFDVTGVGGRVVTAKLRATATADGTTDGPALYSAAGGWTESGLTWANRPVRGTQPVADVGAIAPGTSTDYDVRTLVNGNGTVNMALATTVKDNVDLASREHLAIAMRPQLVVTFETDDSDTQPPSAPGGLTAQAAADRVNLSWAAATDNIAVSGYEVLRDGNTIATLGGVTSYIDTTVAPGTSYQYAVKAFDAAGNRSAASDTQSVTTPTPSASTTLTFDVVADAHVEQRSPAANFGVASKLHVVGGSKPFEAFLRFAPTGIAGTVQAAKLRVYVSDDASNNGPAVYGATSSWTETAITWSNRPSHTSAPSANAGAIAAGTWVEYDVRPFVAGNGDVTFALVGDSSDGVNFSARENPDATKKAQLQITFAGP